MGAIDEERKDGGIVLTVRQLVAVVLLASSVAGMGPVAYNKYSPSARADGITRTEVEKIAAGLAGTVDSRLTDLREKHLDEHHHWKDEINDEVRDIEYEVRRLRDEVESLRRSNPAARHTLRGWDDDEIGTDSERTAQLAPDS